MFPLKKIRICGAWEQLVKERSFGSLPNDHLGWDESPPPCTLSAAITCHSFGAPFRSFLFSALIFGFLNGIFWFFYLFDFPPVFLHFWKKNRIFFCEKPCFCLLPREARFCFCERHETRFSSFRERHNFVFVTGTVMPRGNEKKNHFFPSPRGMVCFCVWHDLTFARATPMLLGNKKKLFSLFSFRKRHEECLFRKGKKGAPWLVFCSIFLWKNSSKSINIGSSFEDLDARNPTAKAVGDLDTRFKR